MKKAKKKEETEEFDPSVIDSAMAKQKLLKAPQEGKKVRGRQATRPDIYIKDSFAMIKDLESRLANSENKLSTEEKRLLRNKKAALQCRINSKLEKESLKRELEDYQARF